MAIAMPIDEIRVLMRYEPETGEFIRLKRTNNRVKVGDVCGFVDVDGYRRIRVGKLVLAHRLAWAIMTGEWPSDEIDHVNGMRDDNRWVNLRQAARYQNAWNMKAGKPNSTGFRGVVRSSHSPGRFEAAITAHRQRYHLGTYDSPEAAHAAYCDAAHKLHGEFARTT